MPQKQPPIPKLRHHKASGQAAVVIDGKWIYLGRHGTAVAEEAYNRTISEWLNNGRRLPPEPDAMTISELYLAYWQHASARYVRPDGRPKGELSAIRCAMRPLRELYGSTPAAEFGPLKLTTIQRRFIAAGYARTIVNDQVQRVRRMFKWAVANELIPPSVFHGLQAVTGLRIGESKARESRDVQPVPEPRVNAVLARVNRQVRAMIELQLLCGARPAEIAMMRAADIDMNRFGRHVLAPDEIRASNFVGGALLLAVVFAGLAALTGQTALGVAAGMSLLMIIPIAGTFSAEPNHGRAALATYTVLLGVVGLGTVALTFAGQRAAVYPGLLFLLGLFGYGWVANVIYARKPG
jgi:hypothetical protein